MNQFGGDTYGHIRMCLVSGYRPRMHKPGLAVSLLEDRRAKLIEADQLLESRARLARRIMLMIEEIAVLDQRVGDVDLE